MDATAAFEMPTFFMDMLGVDSLEAPGMTPSNARIRSSVATSVQGVENAVAQIERDLGPIEVSIHVAGIIQVGPLEATTREHFEQAVDQAVLGGVVVVEIAGTDVELARHQRERGLRVARGGGVGDAGPGAQASGKLLRHAFL